MTDDEVTYWCAVLSAPVDIEAEESGDTYSGVDGNA